MKIAWFTPFNPQSAIARYSAMVASELLRRGHSVVIIRSEKNPSETPSRESLCSVRNWDDVEPAKLKQEFDVVVYNIGDNFPYHGGIFRHLDQVPGVGIFHDAYIYHLFTGWLRNNNCGASEHDDLVRRSHGDAAALAASAYRQGHGSLAGAARLHPMTPWVASRVRAAVVHSGEFVDQLSASCPGPVSAQHLVYSIDHEVPPAREDRDRVVISTFGLANPNKCIDRVIQALGRSAGLRQRCEYRIVGEIGDRYRQVLEEIAAVSDFNSVVFVGRVDDTSLLQELANADIICCLRRPILETASASAIEAMLCGRPVVVADAGFYRELPDDLVFKVDAAVSVARLSEVFDQLVADSALRTAVGQRVKIWARDHFSVERYCDGLVDLLGRSIEVGPLIEMTECIGRTLAEIGVRPHDPSVARISATIRTLFNTNLR